MSFISESVRTKVTEYGAEVSQLSIDLAIETYRDLRNYPKTYTEDRIESDMATSINKIAMAAIEIDSKDGVENQTSHSENGTTRGYANGILAYRDVLAISHVY